MGSSNLQRQKAGLLAAAQEPLYLTAAFGPWICADVAKCHERRAAWWWWRNVFRKIWVKLTRNWWWFFSDIMKIIEDISMVRPRFLQTAPASSSSPSPEIPLLWPQQCHLHHPPVITKITIFIGGINLPFPVMGGLWHCFARISCC